MNLIKYKKAFLIFSLAVMIPGIISLIVFGLNFSVDFTGGSLLKFVNVPSQTETDVRNIIESNSVAVEEQYKEDDLLVFRTHEISADTNLTIKNAVKEKYPESDQYSFETIGSSVGAETGKNLLKALLIVSVGILFYIAYAFRNIPQKYSSFRFGVSAVVAMLHDAVILLGIFSILGKFFGVQIDPLFITAVLTVIGFSVHDTIVVFDRIRENLKKLSGEMTFAEVANYSIVETLNRSLATSLTVVITLFALLVLGGESIKTFVLALLIGIISGTYSSIFTATPLLVLWEEKSKSKKKK